MAKDPARKKRLDILSGHAGRSARTAMNHHWPTSTFESWDEALDLLRSGITVDLKCTHDLADPQAMARPRTHRLRFNPDGSVELLDHPDEGPVDDEREQNERVLAALSALAQQPSRFPRPSHETSPYACLHAALVLPRRSPTITTAPDAGANPLHAGDPQVGSRLRTLHTLVQWASQPVADLGLELAPALGDATLRYGITPRVLEQYLDAGWNLRQALPWLQWRIPLIEAERWRAEGRSSASNARLCGLGERFDASTPWQSVRLTVAQASAWSRVDGITPQIAENLQSRGINTRTYRSFVSDMVWTPGDRWAQTLIEWVDAGVPAETVAPWLINRMPLAVAVEWARHDLTYAHFMVAHSLGVRSTAHASPTPAPLTPSEVAAYIPYLPADEEAWHLREIPVMKANGMTFGDFVAAHERARKRVAKRQTHFRNAANRLTEDVERNIVFSDAMRDLSDRFISSPPN